MTNNSPTSPEDIAATFAAMEAKIVKLPAGEPNALFLARAEALMPVLQESCQSPISLVRALPDADAYLRFRMEVVATAAEFERSTWRQGQEFIIDFGGHRTGHLSFQLLAVDGPADSPVKLRLTFGEVPSDVAVPLYPYTGVLSAAWLPDETFTVDDLPQLVRVPRRHAFRFVKVEVLAASSRFGVQFHHVTAHALTAASKQPEPLASASPEWLKRVDEISIATLRDCLQTSFEDGPRRDRRLWLGDLRLQALANYVSFEANDVVRRCLYLLAGLPRADGLVNGCVYERPQASYADTVMLDYAAIYNVTLQEYVHATGDVATGKELWPVALRQIELLCETVGEDDLFVDTGATFCFIDWVLPLERSTAMQGVLIFTLRRTLLLASQLGCESDVAHYAEKIERMVLAAREKLFDVSLGMFVSGPAHQLSCASQAWMVLSGVPVNDVQAATALRQAMSLPQSIKPATPYLYHYIVEAMVTCGMSDEALALVRHYWGGMADAGADTFWEVYEPGKPLSSPLGDIHINSYCHAWSCTPSWFFRAFGLGLKSHT